MITRSQLNNQSDKKHQNQPSNDHFLSKVTHSFREKLVKAKDKKNNHHPKLSDVSKLINLVADKTDITRTEIFSPCRTRAVSSARSLCFVLLRELMNISLPRIG